MKKKISLEEKRTADTEFTWTIRRKGRYYATGEQQNWRVAFWRQPNNYWRTHIHVGGVKKPQEQLLFESRFTAREVFYAVWGYLKGSNMLDSRGVAIYHQLYKIGPPKCRT